MIIRKAYKFRLKTNQTLARKLAQFAGSSRLVWNKALAFQKEKLNAKQSCLSYAGLTKELTQWKKQEELFFLKQVHSQALQQSLKNLSQAIKEAFDKTNPKQFPKFKKKGQRDSFRYPQGFKIDSENGRIFLPKIGWVRYNKSQDVIGFAKNVTVSKRGKHWFVSIQVEINREIHRHSSSSIVGGDLGIAKFLTLSGTQGRMHSPCAPSAACSNQEYYEPISIFKKLKAKLAKLQKRLAKKEKFSNRWRRLKSKITKLHIRIADTRNDYLHKISSQLSKNHAIVILEDLKISNMSKSAKGTVENPGKNVKQKSGLNRAILDQGWGEFTRQLEYKLAWHGGQLIQVNPRNTSRKCPKCNYISAENRKTQATFCCQQRNCNYTANADYVGSLNIKEAGLALLGLGESLLEHSLKSQPTEGV